MSLFLDKLLPIFVYPLGATLLLLIVAWALSMSRSRRLASWIIAIAFVGLWIAATPVLANRLTWELERRYPPQLIEGLPEVDAIVLLGGIVSQPTALSPTPNLGEASDRILEAVRIYRSGKAPRVVVSGGNLPWQSGVAPESQLIADLLVEFGVPRSAIILEMESRNTYENAHNTVHIFRENGWTSGLLVTSGMHMPRALATFRKAGLNLDAAATDIRARLPFLESSLDLLPDADALARTTSVIKEVIGLFVYRQRAWA